MSHKYQPVLKTFIVQPPEQLWKVNPEVLHPVHQDQWAELYLHSAQALCQSRLKKRQAAILFVSCILPTTGILPHVHLWLNKT